MKFQVGCLGKPVPRLPSAFHGHPGRYGHRPHIRSLSTGDRIYPRHHTVPGHSSFGTAPVIYSDDLVAQCTVLADEGCHHTMIHSASMALIFLRPTSERMMGLPRTAAPQKASSPGSSSSTTLQWPGTER